jgi:lysophospholipase L1-like esterase
MALGSSSTAGAGATTPAATYPARLEAELRSRFPGAAITVLNRGVNCEEAADMLARFDQAAADDMPDVVLWQVGTNSVLREHPIGPIDRLIIEGLARMKALGTAVVLLDPQFAPKVLRRRAVKR